MANLIAVISKYVMIFLMVIYTYANFRFFTLSDPEKQRKVCGRQNRCMFCIHFLAYLTLFLAPRLFFFCGIFICTV